MYNPVEDKMIELLSLHRLCELNLEAVEQDDEIKDMFPNAIESDGSIWDNAIDVEEINDNKSLLTIKRSDRSLRRYNW